MPPLREDERATSPVVGAVLLLVLTVLVGAAIGAGVFLNKDTVNAGIEIAVADGEATVLWTEKGSATYLVVSTGNSLTNATIDSVNGTVTVPGDVGRASANTKIIVRAVNNETRRIIEERTVDLSG